uniref:Uncharacterized protein n=1 Tax=Zea mays TaxID=4577 RepID=A0A804M4Y5_MAIZE
MLGPPSQLPSEQKKGNQTGCVDVPRSLSVCLQFLTTTAATLPAAAATTLLRAPPSSPRDVSWTIIVLLHPPPSIPRFLEVKRVSN